MRSFCLAVLLAGCTTPIHATTDSTTPASATAPPTPTTPAPLDSATAPPLDSAASARRFAPAPNPAEEAAALMAPFALDSREPARRTLFSWTTRAQAEALGKTKKLLVTGPADVSTPNPFEERVRRASGAQLGSRVLALLGKAPLDKRRYAFPNPMGWAVGVTGTPYGPVLLRITLREDAILLLMASDPDPELTPFRAVGMNGAAVPASEIERHPERVAAVFHEGVDPRGVPFREYIVVNEGMVASWDVGTDPIASEIDRARKALEKLVTVSPEEDRPEINEILAAWRGQRPSLASTPWSAALGVGSTSYSWTRKNVAAVAAHLARAERVSPVEHRPDRAASFKLPPPPPPPKQPPRRTYID